MSRSLWFLALLTLLSGCGGGEADRQGAGSSVATYARTTPNTVAPPADPSQAALELAADGCGVIRSEFGAREPDGLQWVITDAEEFQILGRNATDETRYRYFRSGRYEIVLKAWDGNSYADVSNRVTITCP